MRTIEHKPLPPLLIGFCGLLSTCFSAFLWASVQDLWRWGEMLIIVAFGLILSGLAVALTALINRAGVRESPPK